MKIAIVHDALVNLGGAERVLGAFHLMFPNAPIYTTAYFPDRTHQVLRTAQIHTSWLQKIVRTESQLKRLFPLSFRVMGQLDLSAYDLVLSSSTYCAKNVETGATTHVCYCYAPFRPVWEYDQYTTSLDWSPFRKACMRKVFSRVRSIDFKAGQRPTHLVAISEFAAAKLERAYKRRPVAVIYPPVDVNSYCSDSERDESFLVVSRLVSYKRIDVVVEAFNALKMPLTVIGAGPDLERLKKLAASNVRFLGAVSESELRNHYARSRALIFPGEEDFGLPPIEAHASGMPVIAYAGGGALETVIGIDEAAAEAATGVFFHEQTARAVIDAVRRFELSSFAPDRIRQRAMLFDITQFRSRMSRLLEEAYRGTLSRQTLVDSYSTQSPATPEAQRI